MCYKKKLTFLALAAVPDPVGGSYGEFIAELGERKIISPQMIVKLLQVMRYTVGNRSGLMGIDTHRGTRDTRKTWNMSNA